MIRHVCLQSRLSTAFSISLPVKARFDTARYFFKQSWSSEVFVMRGVTSAVLSITGKTPDFSDQFIIRHSIGRCAVSFSAMMLEVGQESMILMIPLLLCF